MYLEEVAVSTNCLIFKTIIIAFAIALFFAFFVGCNTSSTIDDNNYSDSPFKEEPIIIDSYNGNDGNGPFPEEIPTPGIVYCSQGIKWAVEESNNSNHLFSIQFIMYEILKSAFIYDGTTAYDIENSEVFSSYNEDWYLWQVDFRDDYPDFNEWARLYKGESVMEEYKKIGELYNALDKYEGTTEARQTIIEVYQQEQQRLEAAGYDVDFVEEPYLMLTALLTKEQFLNFPYNEKYGYHVLWNKAHD